VGDCRDLAIRDLAADVVAAEARLADLEAERDLYREVLSAALTTLYDITLERDQFRDRYHHALNQHRQARLAGQPEAAA
jgi:hypothetical protein